MNWLLPRASMIVALALCVTCVSISEGAEPDQATASAEQKSTDSWEQFPPAWEKAPRTIGDDSLYLLTSPLRFDLESGLVTGGIMAGIAGLSLADRSIRVAGVRGRRRDL